MIADYELTAEDVCAFNLHHSRHSPTARRQYLLGWFLPAAGGLLICSGLWYLANQKANAPLKTFQDLLPLFLGVPAYLVFFPWSHRRRLRATVKAMVKEDKNHGLFSRHQVTLTPEGITEVSGQGHSSTPWAIVDRVVATDEHVFIYINALAAAIIPRRAFTDPAQFAAFVRTAQDYHRNASTGD
ncbi:MAG: hypothetical protein K0R17_2837 [Rariglobus sp.]|jgi:hypothetical protein|nr:hypothetical protein [Rariglobus sp.]